MQPRLVRSRTDTMIAGVCGGLGEYFNIDPVIVRLIFVLVTMTSGLGLLIYPILWIVMPRSALPTSQSQQYTVPQNVQRARIDSQQFGEQFQQAGAQSQQELQGALRGRSSQQVQQQQSGAPRPTMQAPPYAGDYKFDPQTGQPMWTDEPVTGKTINLRVDQPESAQIFTPPDESQPSYPVSASRRRNWRTFGVILVGIGGLIFLEQFGVTMTFVFPVLLIIAGIILLKRR